MWTLRPADLCRLTGVTPAQLDHFVRLGIIEPLRRAPVAGSAALYGAPNLPEAALARVLTAAGINGQRLQAAFAALRAFVATVPEPLRFTATFVKYIEAVKAIATLLGETNDPAHQAWARQADRILRTWYRNREQLDAQILSLLAAQTALSESSGTAAWR